MFYIFLFLFSVLSYGELDIYSNKIIFDRKNNTIDLKGDVSIKKDKDKILAQSINISLTPKKVVKSFLATKKVELYYNSNKQSFYIRAKEIRLKDSIYTASGNVRMKNNLTKELITANKVTIDTKTDIVVIDGSNSKPINIKLKFKDK
jgi:lipopolysaccharide export system protein LptA